MWKQGQNLSCHIKEAFVVTGPKLRNETRNLKCLFFSVMTAEAHHRTWTLGAGPNWDSGKFILSLLQCLAVQEAIHTSFRSPFHHFVCLDCKVHKGRNYLLERVGALLGTILHPTGRALWTDCNVNNNNIFSQKDSTQVCLQILSQIKFPSRF